MKTTTKAAFAVLTLVMAIGFAAQARAEEIKITVEVDETTAGDLELIQTAVTALADGAEVSKSLRRTTMAVVGEFQLLLGKRIDDSGYLTLDDGSKVGLREGDTISVSGGPGLREGPGATVVLIFQCTDWSTNWNCSRRRPVHLVVRGPDGCVLRRMDIPPSKGNPPVEGCMM